MRPTMPLETWDCHTHIYGPWDQFPLAPDAAYHPAAAPFTALRRSHESLGVTHGVLVQAACYGTNHGALLAALAGSGGRYRGVALADVGIAEAELARLHAGGVRGVRFNFLGHLPGERDPRRLRELAERIAPMGWHILLHGQPRELAPVLDAFDGLALPLVIDHMARLSPAMAADSSSLALLERHLAQPNGWIKLSGVDRMMGGAADAWAGALPLLRQLIRWAPQRCVWGSDWPHPNIEGAAPEDAALLDFILNACGDQATAQAVLSDNPKRLYA